MAETFDVEPIQASDLDGLKEIPTLVLVNLGDLFLDDVTPTNGNTPKEMAAAKRAGKRK